MALAHRPEDPAERGLAEVRADTDRDLAHHDLHNSAGPARSGVRGLPLQESLAPGEQLGRGNPKRRARAETFTPGSSAAAMACALNPSDHPRPAPSGAPSKRSKTASTNCKLPVAGVVVEPVVDMEPRRQTNARNLPQIDNAIKPQGQLPD
jgi:hypothetical protein